MGIAAHIAASDHCFAALVAGLGREFGRTAAEGLARVFIEAEDADFHWDARIEAHVLGTYWGLDEEDVPLDRVAVLGFLDGRFYVAVLLIDGDLAVHGMLGLRHFESGSEAETAYAEAR